MFDFGVACYRIPSASSCDYLKYWKGANATTAHTRVLILNTTLTHRAVFRAWNILLPPPNFAVKLQYAIYLQKYIILIMSKDVGMFIHTYNFSLINVYIIRIAPLSQTYIALFSVHYTILFSTLAPFLENLMCFCCLTQMVPCDGPIFEQPVYYYSCSVRCWQFVYVFRPLNCPLQSSGINLKRAPSQHPS